MGTDLGVSISVNRSQKKDKLMRLNHGHMWKMLSAFLCDSLTPELALSEQTVELRVK